MSTKPQVHGRLEIVDAMRGLAVLAMLILHSAHGWVQPDLRAGAAWYWITSIGGFAAPLFFLMTGVSLGLRWSRTQPPGTRQELARGLGLLVLGYLLRVQMWLVDLPALLDPTRLGPALLLAAGEVGLYRACGRFGEGRSPQVALPAAATGAGVFWVATVAPSDLTRVLRFDVLQGLGLSLALLAVVGHGAQRPSRRAARAVLVAGAVLAATPLLRARLPGPLPPALAAALSAFTTPEGPRWALFPLAPWCAYAGFGTLVGVAWARARRRGGSPPLVLPWAAGGALLATAVSSDWAHVEAFLLAHQEVAPAAGVAYRLGIGLATAGLAWLATHCRWLPGRPLVVLGQASLWVYWIHLEFAFGTFGAPLRRSLGYAAWLAMLAILTIAMWGVARLRVTWRRHRKETGPGARRRVTPGGGTGRVTNLEQGA